MLVAMCGLPGTGKSTLARRLAADLGGVVLSKDAVRAVLFPASVLDHSIEQDDLTMAAIYSAAASIHRSHPGRPVILDGRTFLRAYQIRDLLTLAQRIGTASKLIECVCDAELVRERLERDLLHGEHPARNRTYDMYLRVKARAEPITMPRLVLDTGRTPLDECVRLALRYLRET